MHKNDTSISHLEDFKVNVKIKLAALWASAMSCYIYGDYFSLYVPNKVNEFINGNNMLDNPFKLFLASVLMAIPALMIGFSVILKPRLNKILNLIFGILYTAIMLLIAVTTLSPWWSFYIFLAIVEICITSLIITYAINWPKINK